MVIHLQYFFEEQHSFRNRYFVKKKILNECVLAE